MVLKYICILHLICYILLSATKATYIIGPMEHELSFWNQPVRSNYTVTFSLKLAHIRGLWGRWREINDDRLFEYKNYYSNTVVFNYRICFMETMQWC